MKPITIIPARLTDCSDVFAWRNDPATRSNSKNTTPLDWDTHVAWFIAALKSPNLDIFIGYQMKLKIGSIRFDRLESAVESYLVSIVIAPSQRGQGCGRPLLREGIATRPNAILIAEIAHHNIASRQIFESCGFEPYKNSNDGFLQYRLMTSTKS